MTTDKLLTTDKLAQQIQACAKAQLTGRLKIKDPHGQQWSLSFHLGRLIGGASKMHPIRRWCRQLSVHCPELSAFPVCQGSSVQPVYWDYPSLAELVRQGKVPLKQMRSVVVGNCTEIVFDIIQRQEQLRCGSSEQLTYRQIPQDTIDSTSDSTSDLTFDSKLVVIRADQIWQQASLAWEPWQQAGLVNISPSLAPVIWDADKLRQQTSLLAYHNLTTLVDGDRTLRDLALKLKQNLLALAQSIMPYIRDQVMGLIEVGDWRCDTHFTKATNPMPENARRFGGPVMTLPASPLVVYIEDSHIDRLTMSQILANAGYRFINVQDPIKALPTLLKCKPQLIFLDLVMPVLNGYEVCAQIRRVSVFQDTPVIMVTSNDGIVDRVRAKMVGSTDFLAKPITRSKVLTILQRYLGVSRNILSG
ncbi:MULTISPECIES: response regulator [Moorena]|uniref:Two-component response regulator, CheY subfamily n=2 Tax=Moorena TaxID=1155738 RepID=F4XZC4_9CYAN|nr:MULTISPECIES: response regulator [Moorena]NEQ17072.1 response regulator [Moorena sp. SIO3E2]EGJ30067.1 two-component response regulator, CheY subfamily [Moorena producens 3L]NEP34909.1 response regulator [Moorena sp. SIO3B2]NEP67139.1 response regulator [Moorena sp. SIO3A5]NEQ06485.1 response regulator [Moorena sp. SIO4E2]